MALAKESPTASEPMSPGWAVCGCYYKNSSVHLGSPGDHVLYVVGVTRAVNVSVVTVGGLVFYVRGRYGDSSFFFFRCLVNHIECNHLP